MRRSDIYFFGTIILVLFLCLLYSFGIKIPYFGIISKFWWVVLLPFVFIKITYLFSGGKIFKKTMSWFDTEVKFKK